MITVCLDESGDFEDINYKKKFIGGVIYFGEDPEEEKKRIEDFFNQECKKLNITYPRDIHTTEMSGRSHMETKSEIEKDLIEYIKDNGRYYFTAIIKGNNRAENYFTNSNMVDDRNASNLYDNMISQLIYNTMLYNPVFDNEKDICYEIATRVAVIDEKDEKRIKDYETLGYDRKEKDNGKYIFYLTNQNTYKSIISTKMRGYNANKSIKKLYVDKINYFKTKEDSKKETTPFLYLADFACDIIRPILNENRSDFGIENCYKELKSISRNEPLLWVYDDIDNLWNGLAHNFYYEDRKFVECCSYMYEIENHGSIFAKYYSTHWANKLDERICDTFDKGQLDIYLSQIEYLFRKNRQEYKKGLHIALKLWNIIYTREDVEEIYKYRLADILLRGYNHMGDDINAYKYFKYCEEYKDEVGVEEYLSTINRAVEIDANVFNFSDGIDRLEYSKCCLDILKDAMKEIANYNYMGKQKAHSIDLRGKVLSSLGQFHAFLRDSKALPYFEEALNEFHDSPQNINTTISYILHLALDNRDLSLYEKYSHRYFESNDLEEQYDSIIKNKDNYGLYVFVKSIYVFYYNKIDYKFIEKIRVEDYEGIGFNVGSHPWELIYKYISFLEFSSGKYNIADNYMQKALDCVEGKGTTIRLINIYSQIQYYELKLKDESIREKEKIKIRNNIDKNLNNMRLLVNTNDRLKKYFGKILEITNQEDALDALESKFTYMYR